VTCIDKELVSSGVGFAFALMELVFSLEAILTNKESVGIDWEEIRY
jgi:hypothetical protein